MLSERRMVAEKIPAYTYGTAEAARSQISLKELEELKQSVGLTSDDEKYLKLAGEVLADQTKELVDTCQFFVSSGCTDSNAQTFRRTRKGDYSCIPDRTVFWVLRRLP